MEVVHESANSTQAILDLLLELDWYDWDPELYYHRLLEVALSLIPEATHGTVSIKNPERWYFVASIGYSLDQLLNLKLNSNWFKCQQSSVTEITSILDCMNEATPEDIVKNASAIFGTVQKTLIGTYLIDQGEQIILSIDITRNKTQHFSASSKRTFEAFVKLAGKYQSLTQQKIALQNINESLIYSYEEISALQEKIRQLLSISQQFGDSTVRLPVFFNRLLLVLLRLVDQADYGSIAFIKGENLTFISSFGHHIQAILSKKMKKQWFLLEEEKHIIELPNIHTLWQAKMPAEVYKVIKKSFQPVKSTILFTIPVDEKITILFMLDIAEGKPTNFTPLARRMCLSFAELARGFVRIRIHTEIMKRAYYNFSSKLAKVVEQYDPETGQHNTRVSILSGYLARKINLPRKKVEEIISFAGLHDVGKIFIDPVLLKKTGKLSKEEFDLIKKHTVYSSQLLEGPFFEVARNIAMYHHERWDGKGYPFGLREHQIPIEAQITALADVYDALRSSRIYKEAYDREKALSIIFHGDERNLSGQFNPQLLEILKNNIDEIEKLVYRPELL
ncbi:HD-GYP domain-containing protein [Gracilinema caldarium]|uniref:HD-GYP domain-containing protein n=1 Tax=Gracilinema caldarium TaxID=215591 RepID=UPI0026ED1974|nr:HD-GYP domain-containing protein [Gracilinema caldarium]